MKLKNILLVVEDIERSKKFYTDLFGLQVSKDFGENVILTEGLCLQSASSWADCTGKLISYGGHDSELYFEENDLGCLIETLEKTGIQFVNPIMTREWGQRVVRIYDPDKHVIEIAESMESVCRRFLAQGLTVEETARRSQVPVSFVKSCLTEC